MSSHCNIGVCMTTWCPRRLRISSCTVRPGNRTRGRKKPITSRCDSHIDRHALNVVISSQKKLCWTSLKKCVLLFTQCVFVSHIRVMLTWHPWAFLFNWRGSVNTVKSLKITKHMNPCICLQIRYPISEENRRSQLHQTCSCTALILRTIMTYLHFSLTDREWSKRIVTKTNRKKFYFSITNNFLIIWILKQIIFNVGDIGASSNKILV